MADITMCGGDGCGRKHSCHRYTTTACPYRQSYFCSLPLDKETGVCKHFWPNNVNEEDD